MFLKLTRVVNERAKEEISLAEGKKKELFIMINIFTDKVQSRLYLISNTFIQRVMNSNCFSGNVNNDLMPNLDMCGVNYN